MIRVLLAKEPPAGTRPPASPGAVLIPDPGSTTGLPGIGPAGGAPTHDWMFADRLPAAGCQVLRVWVTAPLVTLLRLAGRRSRKVPVSREEVEWIYREATRRAAARSFTAVLDTSGTPDPSRLDELVTILP